jgi:hypothetical protein
VSQLTALYTVERADCTLFELELPCTVIQDCAPGFASEVLVIWSPEADVEIARYGFSGDELDGAIEAAESAFWLAEHAEERKAMTAQQTGDLAFFERQASEAAA